MQSGADPTRTVSHLTGCTLVTGLGIGLGIGCGFLDYRLAVAARAYCDAGLEAGGVLELNLFLLSRLALMPIVAVVTGTLGMLLYHSLSRAGAMGRAGRYVGVVLGIAVAIAGPIGLMLYDFAVTGTLAGYPGDPSLCGADNVPPWWPSWLPS